jgi:hypothetical protein
MQSCLSTSSVFDPIREDNINLYRNYNILAKQGMSKSQACSAFKIKPGTIDSIRKRYNLQYAHYFVQKRKNPKKKIDIEFNVSKKSKKKGGRDDKTVESVEPKISSLNSKLLV